MSLSIHDLARVAKERLPQQTFDYFDSGAGDEITLAENERAFTSRRLRYRVLRDVSRRDLSTTVLGAPVAMPVLIAPTAFQRLAHDDGESATARAAAAAGIVMTLSTLATVSLEDVRAASTGRLWFQLYVYRDREVTRALVERAEAAGYEALVLTVDLPMLGRRERDVRNQFHLPANITVPNLLPLGIERFGRVEGESGLAHFTNKLLDASLSWPDLEWLKSVTKLPLLVKGVVRGDDAEQAVNAGVAGVIVSNHGGRQLDTAVASLDALEDVVQSVGGRAEVLVDGGVRRGTDVIKAISLGARAVLIGRAAVWGLAADGEAGVTRALTILRDELDLAMALCGCANIGEITRDLVVP